MNPLAITPAFSGEIEIPQAAILERDEIITTSKQIVGVSSDQELALAVSVLRDLTGLEKVTEAGREKEKRPFLDFGKLIDTFAKKFVAPVTAEKARITEYVNEWQRKEVKRKAAEEMERAKRRWQAEEDARKAKAEIEAQQREIERQKLAAENAKTAAAKAKAAEALKQAEATQLKQRLAAEEASMAAQTAAIIPAANTPQGLATRVSYDFEIVNPDKAYRFAPQLWRWKAGEETLHFDRQTLRAKLNSEVPNEYTGWRPQEGSESVVNSDYGIRVYISVKTNVRS